MTDTNYILPDPEQQARYDVWAAISRPYALDRELAVARLTLEEAIRNGRSERLRADLLNCIQKLATAHEQMQIRDQQLLGLQQVRQILGTVAAILHEELAVLPLPETTRIDLIDRLAERFHNPPALLLEAPFHESE